jgi:hypothetical protein
MGLDSILSALAGKGRTGRVADAPAFLTTLVGAGTARLRDAVGIFGIVSDDSTDIVDKDPH